MYHVQETPGIEYDVDDHEDVVESFGVLDYIFAPILGIILLLSVILLFRYRYYSLACLEMTPSSLYRTFICKTFGYRMLLFAAATVIVNINPGVLTGSLYALIIFALFIWDFLARRGDQICKHDDIQTKKIVAQVEQILPEIQPQTEGFLENIGWYRKEDIITDRLKMIYQENDLDKLPAKIAADPQLVAFVGQKSMEWPINPSFDYKEAMGGDYAVYKPAGQRQMDQFGGLEAMYQKQKGQVTGLPDFPKRQSKSSKRLSKKSQGSARERETVALPKQKTPEGLYDELNQTYAEYQQAAQPKQTGWFGF